MTPLAISPPSSTPEPDMSSIPQDAATIPHSATPQVLTGGTPQKKYLYTLWAFMASLFSLVFFII